MNQKFVQDIHVQGVSQSQRLNQIFTQGTSSQQPSGKELRAIPQSINNYESNQQQQQSFGIGQQTIYGNNSPYHVTQDTQKRNMSKDNQLKFTQYPDGDQNDKFIDKSLFKTRPNFKDKVQLQKQQQHQSSMKTQINFSMKQSGQFEVNLSQLSKKVEIDFLKAQGDKNDIDFSRFQKKEVGKKMLSQSQLLFEQLRKKTQNNNLNNSNDCGRAQEQKKGSSTMISQQHVNLSQQSIAILSDRPQINNYLALSTYNQQVDEQGQSLKIQEQRNSSITVSKFNQDEQLSPLRKVNKPNKSIQQFDNFASNKEFGSRINSEQVSQANFSEKLTSFTSLTQVNSPHIIKSGINLKINKDGILNKNTHHTLLNGVTTTQISVMEILPEQGSVKTTNRQKASSIQQFNQSSLMDKISKNIQKNQEQYKKTSQKLLDYRDAELTSPINNINNSVIESDGLIQRQRDILSRKSIKKRSGTMINLKEKSPYQYENQTNENQMFFSNNDQLEQNQENKNQLQNRIQNKIELKIPQSPYRKGSANSLINYYESNTFTTQSQSNLHQYKLQSEESPVSSSKIRTSQFRQKSQIIFPVIMQNSSQQDIFSPLSNSKNMTMLTSYYNGHGNLSALNKQKLQSIESTKNTNNLHIHPFRNKNISSQLNNNHVSEHVQKSKSINLKQYIIPHNFQQNKSLIKTPQQNYQTALTEGNANLSAQSPTQFFQFNYDSEEDLQNLNIIKTSSQLINPACSNTPYNALPSFEKKKEAKYSQERSQDQIYGVEDSPLEQKVKILSGDNFSSELQFSSLQNYKVQNKNMVRSHENLLQNNIKQIQNKQNLNKINLPNSNGNQSLPHINTSINSINKNKQQSIFVKINQKLRDQGSFHSSSDLSPIQPLKSSNYTYSKKGFSYYSQQVENNETENIFTVLSNKIMDYFQYQQLKKYPDQLSNVKFRTQTFQDFINNSISNKTEESQNQNQANIKQKVQRKELNFKLGYAKEQLKLIGITPNILTYIIEEIVEILNQIQEQSQNNEIIIEPFNIKIILENINNYIKQNIHWTLLDQFGSEQELQNISSQLYEIFSQDPLCTKFLNIFKIDEKKFWKIVYSTFQNDFIHENLCEEVSLRMKEYQQSISVIQEDSTSSSSDMTYADFFYIKYKIMYFCLEKNVSLKILFTILEIIEKLRYVILKKPNSIESINYDTFGFQLRMMFKSNSKIHHILSERGINGNKFEQMLGNLTSVILNKSISLYPINKLPNELDIIFLSDYDSIMQLSNGLLKLLNQNYKCEKHVILDAKLSLSTLKIGSNLKQSLNNSLITDQNTSFDKLLNRLLNILEENQTLAHYTSLSNPINLKVFTLNLLCYLFDIFVDDQPFRTYTLDIKAQFKMFGCSFVSFNDFLIQIHSFLSPQLPQDYLQDFIYNSCRDLKGLDIFD